MNILLLLAGGIGSRMQMGTLPKQYLLCNGRPVISYSLKTFDSHAMIGKIVIVAEKEWHDTVSGWMKEENIEKFYAYAEPGQNRQHSILNGLKIIKEFALPEDIVIIHDAARPFISEELITTCLKAIDGHDGVMPSLPAKDTFYLIGQEKQVAQILPRERLAAGQAPEAFHFGRYLQANESIGEAGLLKINGSTEIAVKSGLDVVTVPGEERNFKITTQDDLLLMQAYLEREGR